MNRWIIQREKKLHGPFTTEQIKERTLNGSLRATDLISREGSNVWQPFGAVKGQFASPPATIAPKPTLSRPPQSAAPARFAPARTSSSTPQPPSTDVTAICKTPTNTPAGFPKRLLHCQPNGGSGGGELIGYIHVLLKPLILPIIGMGPVDVLIDQTPLARLPLGQEAKLPVAAGSHLVRLRLHGLFMRHSPQMRVTVANGQEVSMVGAYSRMWGTMRLNGPRST